MPHSPGFLGKHLGQGSAPKNTACAERRKRRKPMREMAASPLWMWGSARMPSLRNRSEAAAAVRSQVAVPLSLRFLNYRKTSTSHLFLSPCHTSTRHPSGASMSALQTPLAFTEAMPGPGLGGENDHLASTTSELYCARSTAPVRQVLFGSHSDSPVTLMSKNLSEFNLLTLSNPMPMLKS